jgi:hypothetical protein
MTAAEAIRELRELIAEQLRQPDVDEAMVKSMLWTVHYVAEDGYVNGLNEIRLRRYRRRCALLRRAGLRIADS